MYSFLSLSFCIVVLLSNILSAKMLSLGGVLVPIGVFFYPFTFLLSDLVVELYGIKRAKTMVYGTLVMNILAFGMIQIALFLPGQSEEIDRAFRIVLGLSGLRIFSSLVAYSVAQILDVYLYAKIRQWTGPKFLWVRSNGATGLSQIVDTIILDLIYLYGGMRMAIFAVAPTILFTIIYKLFFSFALTPLLYLIVFLIKNRESSLKL